MARGRTPEAPKPAPEPEPVVKATVARTVRIDFPNAKGGTNGYVEGRVLGNSVRLDVYQADHYSSFGGRHDALVPDAQWDEFVGLLDRQRKLAEAD